MLYNFELLNARQFDWLHIVGPWNQKILLLVSFTIISDLCINDDRRNSNWIQYNADSGRALEELRSSLYNELRTSEGAKRQQQRICGPIVAMTFNFMVAVGIILGNKLVRILKLNVDRIEQLSTPFGLT